MRSIDKECTPNEFGFYKADPNSIYNRLDEEVYVLYTHNVRRKIVDYNGKLYVPFIFRGKRVLLKGGRLYPR